TYTADLRQLLRDEAHESRLVALATVRVGREERRVRLDEHPVCRRARRDMTQLIRLLEGQRPGEADVEAELQRRLRVGPARRERVQHAGAAGERWRQAVPHPLAEQREQVRGRVAVVQD